MLDHARPHARGLSASYLHALIQFCPQPKHAAAYARMIRADNARRILRGHAERLASTATDPGLPNPVAATLGLADDIGRVLDSLAEQFTPHPGSFPRTALPRMSHGRPARKTSTKSASSWRPPPPIRQRSSRCGG